MYPETDVRPIPVPRQRLADIAMKLPELPDAKAARLAREYGVHEQQARQIVREGHDDLFEELAKGGQAQVAARTFLNTYPALEKEGVRTDVLTDGQVRESFQALNQGRFAKEALPDVLRRMAQGMDLDTAIKDLGLARVDDSEAAAIVDAIIAERAAFVREKGVGAVGPLMAPVMAQLKGKLEGKAASDLLRSRIEAFLAH